MSVSGSPRLMKPRYATASRNGRDRTGCSIQFANRAAHRNRLHGTQKGGEFCVARAALESFRVPKAQVCGKTPVMAKVSAVVMIYDIRGFTAASKKLATADLGAFATAAHK